MQGGERNCNAIEGAIGKPGKRLAVTSRSSIVRCTLGIEMQMCIYVLDRFTTTRRGSMVEGYKLRMFITLDHRREVVLVSYADFLPVPQQRRLSGYACVSDPTMLPDPDSSLNNLVLSEICTSGSKKIFLIIFQLI